MKKELKRRDYTMLAMIRGEFPGAKPKVIPSKKRYRRHKKHKGLPDE